MSNAASIALLVATAVLAVVAFVALRPSGDESGTPAAATQPAPTATAPGTIEPAPGATTSQATTPAPRAPAEPRVPTIRVRDGEVVGGVRELEVRAGEEVAFRVRSDVADEVHVHGYDLHRDVAPGRTATVRFDADLEGVFEVELEDAGTPIARPIVEPR